MYAHCTMHTFQTQTSELTVGIQVWMFHFRHKIIVANILFGYHFPYFSLRIVWFLRETLIFVLFGLDALFFPFDSSDNARYLFSPLECEKTFSHVPFVMLSLIFVRFFCLTQYEHNFPIDSLERDSNCFAFAFLQALWCLNHWLFASTLCFTLFVEIFLASRWCLLPTKIWYRNFVIILREICIQNQSVLFERGVILNEL